jgi:3-isopropylmalate dehydrogenase
MLLRFSLDLPAEADAVERAVDDVLDASFRTNDIESPGTTVVGTRRMGDLIAERVRRD